MMLTFLEALTIESTLPLVGSVCRNSRSVVRIKDSLLSSEGYSEAGGYSSGLRSAATN